MDNVQKCMKAGKVRWSDDILNPPAGCRVHPIHTGRGSPVEAKGKDLSNDIHTLICT